MAPLKVGLMGYGFSTKSFHLPFILPNPDLKVHAFLQRAEAQGKAGHCTVDYPHAKHYRTAEDFFADSEIDLVIVCTQHDSHADFAERALLAGKHGRSSQQAVPANRVVVVEKPFTVSTEEANRVIAAAEKSGKILTVFQNRRYDSDFRTLRHLVENKAFGEITEAETHYDVDFPFWMSSWKSPDWSPGDGMMFGLGSHTIDQALVLFGRPRSVTGFYRSLRGIESKTDDTFTIILQYTGNLVVTVKTSVVATMQYPMKYFVRGYDGTFIKYGEDIQESQISRGLTATSDGFGMEPQATFGVLTTKKQFDASQEQVAGKWIGNFPSFKGDYTGFYTDLIKAIRGEADLVVKPEESRDGITIIELARRSADEGRTLYF